jgi:hypothetical protein
MPLVERHIGRHNLLEIFDEAGRLVARRRVVHALSIAGRTVTHVAAADEPAEVLALPVERRSALDWLLEHFNDLPGRDLLNLADRMSARQTLEEWLRARPPGGRYKILMPGDEGYDDALGSFDVTP